MEPRNLIPRHLTQRNEILGSHQTYGGGGGVFTAALFVTAPKWEQSRCSSMGERINKPWYNNDYTDTTIWIHLQVNYTE